MLTSRRFRLSSVACLYWLSATPAAAEPPANPFKDSIQGVTISTHRGGGDWGSDRMPEGLKDIRSVGANWVAIHPYAGIGAEGQVRSRRFGRQAQPPSHIVRPIREAHALGLKILLKPHLAYWGSPFAWRGEIGFDREAHWERFFSQYQAFIVRVAQWSEGADGLVVGTELDKTVKYEREWRVIIAKVREVYDGPILYAANWDRYEEVPFWDALDAIGIQAYFPLTTERDTSEEAIARGWDRWMGRLAQFADKHDRPIVFAELGYNRSYRATIEPWDYKTDDDGARHVQELALRIALERVKAEPSVQGVFLWKWFLPPRPVGRNFQLATPGMRRVIRGAWLEADQQ